MLVFRHLIAAFKTKDMAGNRWLMEKKGQKLQREILKALCLKQRVTKTQREMTGVMNMGTNMYRHCLHAEQTGV